MRLIPRIETSGRSVAVIALAIAAALVLAEAASAQPQASQHGTVSQIVNTTTITLEYDRPVLRGRVLFEDLLDFDAIWTPGANRATWIEFSGPVTIEGQPLEAGRYGIWAIPHLGGAWDWIFVRDWDTHHSFYPMETEALRVRVRPLRGEHMETLAFYFPVVESYETTLRFHWGEIVVPFRIQVEE